MKRHIFQIISISIAVAITATYLLNLPSILSESDIKIITMDPKSAQSILDFWFSPSHTLKDWYSPDTNFDKTIRSKFGALHAQISAPNEYRFVPSAGPKVALAAIILLDQFSRNLYRGSPKAYENDASARQISEKCIARDWDIGLKHRERAFMFMPLMHAEDMTGQTLGVVLFRDLAEKATADMKEEANSSLKFAKAHYRTIEKFGRFPARNDALGRQSTEEEKLLVAEGKGGFVHDEEE